MLEPIPFAGYVEIDEMNKPVAWINEEMQVMFRQDLADAYPTLWKPLYTHPVINNGGNLEELNTKVQDASTSLESTPPINAEPVGRYYWESVVDGHFMAVPSEGTIHYEIDDFPLYLHPVKELNDGGEPVKNATYWKRQYNLMATQNDNLKSGLYHANGQIKYLEFHPVKELTDEEIEEFAYAFQLWQLHNPDKALEGIMDFARAILKKARE